VIKTPAARRRELMARVKRQPGQDSLAAKFGLRTNSKAARFLELAQPDDDGFSRAVPIEEFVGRYQDLVMGNGGNWCRSDGSLARVFNVRRIKQKNKIVAVQLHGFKKRPIDKTIPAHILTEIRAQRCAVLGTSNPECDHKDGHRDDWGDPAKLTVDDFQPLSSAANKAKREVCKKCQQTKQRFDATTLGFAVAQFVGNGVYEGSCVGCYWHDVRRFHAEASK